MTGTLPEPTDDYVLREVALPIMTGQPLVADDDFFDADVSSVRVVQMVSRCQAIWGVDVSMLELFDDPSVAGLARLVRKELAGSLGGQVGA